MGRRKGNIGIQYNGAREQTSVIRRVAFSRKYWKHAGEYTIEINGCDGPIFQHGAYIKLDNIHC